MAGSSLFALIDDIATLLDDVRALGHPAPADRRRGLPVLRRRREDRPPLAAPRRVGGHIFVANIPPLHHAVDALVQPLQGMAGALVLAVVEGFRRRRGAA